MPLPAILMEEARQKTLHSRTWRRLCQHQQEALLLMAVLLRGLSFSVASALAFAASAG